MLTEQHSLCLFFSSGPNRGHYITIVKSHGFWLLFDDDIVEVGKQMIISEGAGWRYSVLGMCAYGHFQNRPVFPSSDLKTVYISLRTTFCCSPASLEGEKG